MTGKTHVAVGMATSLTLSLDQPLKKQLIIVIASVVGSLIPDLDHPNGTINRKFLLKNNNFFRVLFYSCLGIFLIYLDESIGNTMLKRIGISLIFLSLSSHRSFSHSLLGFLSCSYIIEYVTEQYGLPEIYIGFTIGYILHLVLDFFTPKGIQLFYPIKKNVSFPITIKTNGKMEQLIFISVNTYCLCLLLKYLNRLKISY